MSPEIGIVEPSPNSTLMTAFWASADGPANITGRTAANDAKLAHNLILMARHLSRLQARFDPKRTSSGQDLPTIVTGYSANKSPMIVKYVANLAEIVLKDTKYSCPKNLRRFFEVPRLLPTGEPPSQISNLKSHCFAETAINCRTPQGHCQQRQGPRFRHCGDRAGRLRGREGCSEGRRIAAHRQA